jgi:small subunit ribosomal protein S1
MSWTTRIKHPSEVLKRGEEVQAVLLSIDVDNERLSLGVKQLQPNPWEGIADSISVGENVSGKVVRLTDFGAFIELANGVEGLLHVSEISRQHVKKPEDVLNIGDEITAKVIKLDEDNRRIGLSIKAYEEETGGGEEGDEDGEAAETEGETPTPEEASAAEEAAEAPATDETATATTDTETTTADEADTTAESVDKPTGEETVEEEAETSSEESAEEKSSDDAEEEKVSGDVEEKPSDETPPVAEATAETPEEEKSE